MSDLPLLALPDFIRNRGRELNPVVRIKEWETWRLYYAL
jgi:hypothetical protein